MFFFLKTGYYLFLIYFKTKNYLSIFILPGKIYKQADLEICLYFF